MICTMIATQNPDDTFDEETWPKTCECCLRSIAEEQWESLEYVGIQKGIDEIPDFELRRCSCQTTLAIVVPRDFA